MSQKKAISLEILLNLQNDLEENLKTCQEFPITPGDLYELSETLLDLRQNTLPAIKLSIAPLAASGNRPPFSNLMGDLDEALFALETHQPHAAVTRETLQPIISILTRVLSSYDQSLQIITRLVAASLSEDFWSVGLLESVVISKLLLMILILVGILFLASKKVQ